MTLITSIISLVLSTYCYAYCGTSTADISPLEPKTEINQEA